MPFPLEISTFCTESASSMSLRIGIPIARSNEKMCRCLRPPRRQLGRGTAIPTADPCGSVQSYSQFSDGRDISGPVAAYDSDWTVTVRPGPAPGPGRAPWRSGRGLGAAAAASPAVPA